MIYSNLPVCSLNWKVKSWSVGLADPTRGQFLSVSLKDLLANPIELLHQPWIQELSEEKNFEPASATMLYAHKPGDA